MPPVPKTENASLQRKSYPFSGRLTVLKSGATGANDPFAGLDSLVHLNFPMMPENGIELNRTADYIVNQVITSPDGFHQFKATNPLSIPISFKLHSFDKEFCPQGALSVLQVAALLHSFIIPISDSGGNSLTVTLQQADPGGTPNGDTDSLTNRAQSASTNYSITPEAGSNFAAPVTLRLDLMFVSATSPGIVCVGYVKDVRAKLNGPFLRGPENSYNLPTSGDFEFTFVHVPGYGNSFNIASSTPQQQVTIDQAFADDVRKKLYNTVGISKTSTAGFTSFNQ